ILTVWRGWQCGRRKGNPLCLDRRSGFRKEVSCRRGRVHEMHSDERPLIRRLWKRLNELAAIDELRVAGGIIRSNPRRISRGDAEEFTLARRRARRGVAA